MNIWPIARKRPWSDLHVILRNVFPPQQKALAEALTLEGKLHPLCTQTGSRVLSSALTNPGGSSPTSAGGQRAAPLAVAPTLGSRCTLQQVAGVAGEVHDIIQVELAAISETVRRVPWVATGDGYGGRQVHINKSSLSLGIPY